MRRTGLVLALCALGAVMPSTAAATTFQGTCTFDIGSSFSGDGYVLGNAGNNGACNGSLNGGATEGLEARLTSSGSGRFACEAATFGAGTGTIDFYRFVGQVRIYADTLTIIEGPGAGARGEAVRRVTGERGGLAIERSRGDGFCGIGSRVAQLQTAQLLQD